MNLKARVIAFYLPQFYPTPENDEWWGKGFTEWTNVGRAKPLYKGHYQPKVPSELSYYDLRVSETRQKQAALASEYGIDGFCYWHYWFSGRRLLSDVFQDVVDSGTPNFPFCLCWANHSWYKKTWDGGSKDKLLICQEYPGKDDYIAHFNAMLPAFKDDRYIREDGKLLFCIYAPLDIPDFLLLKGIWNELAIKNGLPEFHFKGFTMNPNDKDVILNKGFDSVILDYVFSDGQRNITKKIAFKLKNKIFKLPKLRDYNIYIDTIQKEYTYKEKVDLCVIPNFDHSPRSQHKGVIYYNSCPKLWGKLLDYIFGKLNYNKILFIKAWNEWGEGNYLEPDLKYGRGWLEQIKKYKR